MNDTMNDNIDQATYDIIKVYIAQTQSAIKISETICKHSDRDELSGDDILCGLVYRLMVPMTDNEMQECMNSADEILEGEESSDEDDKEEFIDEIKILENSEWRQIKSNHCNCDICCQVRVKLLNYESYEPMDILSERFKNSIKETSEKYKIII